MLDSKACALLPRVLSVEISGEVLDLDMFSRAYTVECDEVSLLLPLS